MTANTPPNLPYWEQEAVGIHQDASDILQDRQRHSDELYRLDRDLTAEQRRQMEQTQQRQ